jgi:hypothetical protein
MPGVVMIEITAQLCAWLGTYSINAAPGKFMGFGGVNHARFRGKVVPGDTLLVATQIQKLRRSLGTFLTQAWVRNELIFEGEILGVGEQLVIERVGAYNITQSMQFITYRPNVVLIDLEGNTHIIRKKESLETFKNSEVNPKRK